jgi:ketol-acid reductoisomerase
MDKPDMVTEAVWKQHQDWMEVMHKGSFTKDFTVDKDSQKKVYDNNRQEKQKRPHSRPFWILSVIYAIQYN